MANLGAGCDRRGQSHPRGTTSSSAGPSFDFWRVVRLYQSEGLDRSAAIRKATSFWPDLHGHMLNDNRPSRPEPAKPTQPPSPQPPSPQHRQSSQPTGVQTMQSPRTFEEAVAAAIRAGKTRSEAIRSVVRDFPELHGAVHFEDQCRTPGRTSRQTREIRGQHGFERSENSRQIPSRGHHPTEQHCAGKLRAILRSAQERFQNVGATVSIMGEGQG